MVSPSSAVGERLSVTTAIIGLLAVGGKIIDNLWDLSTTPNKRSNATFAQALQEVRQCRSTIHVLYKTLSLLESAQLPYPERGTWIKADDLIAVLTDTVLAVSALQAICETLNLGKPGLATPPPDDADLEIDGGLPSKKTIEGLCSRIRWHNLSMTMMMTILKCPGESDAQNSKVGLDRRMARLLSANTFLSSRMRQLDRVFGRRETLLHYYSSPARHPHFWLLPRLAPYPGTAAANRLPATAPAPNIGNATTAAAAAAAEGNAPAAQSSSPLRGYTLADIAALSTVSLPVTTNELVDGNFFYTFAYARRVSGDLSELMASQAGQGTSRSLGIILGRLTNTSIDHGASSSSTGGSSSDSNSSPVVAGAGAGAGTETGSEANDGHAKAKKWKVRSFRVKRRWRA
ncbi:hypothetical protein C2857_006610 [Epichloe festucae Fl1]|uniref:Uncharacterized protein n=1 Tax=Epichloe festucae (strain Fl1) TaxID=877507 RepID=A0A7S9KTR5_EPIFF|nr:hypothetical protein C2857_006610 [Epichloe festucae Fl1]